MDTLLLACGLVAAITAVNAWVPRRGRLFLVPSFFASWLTIELAPWALFWEVVTTVVLVAEGGLDSGRGWAGLGLMLGSWAALAGIIATARRTTVTVGDAHAELELDPDDDAPRFPRSHVVFPILMRSRPGVTVQRNIVFAEVGGKRLRLDVHRPADAGPDGGRRPGILQIHGGAWILGDKREQGIPLLNHLAANGWVGINANYRLSPRHAFPTHLVDVKRAIAWYREHAAEHGADPDFLCVTGGSAGGHLAALVGLTAGLPAYQPGFEQVDTSVRAAVPIYGIYDFTNRFGSWHAETVDRFFGRMILKRRYADDPEAFHRASPIDLVRPDAPPFFVVHGDLDTLAPVADARAFVSRLREVSEAPVLYAEMKGSQHAFDVFPSYRTARVIEGIERFLTAVHRAYLAGRPLRRRVTQLADDLTADDAPVHHVERAAGSPTR